MARHVLRILQARPEAWMRRINHIISPPNQREIELPLIRRLEPPPAEAGYMKAML
jgi:hypothetical protein